MNHIIKKDKNLKDRELQLIINLLYEQIDDSLIIEKKLKILSDLKDTNINNRNKQLRLIMELLHKEGYRRDAIYKKISIISGLAISTLHNVRYCSGRYAGKNNES